MELRNLTDQTISLCSWILSSGLSRVSSYDLGTSEIPPDGYLTLLRSSTGIPLGNEGGKLLLLAPRLVGTGTSIVQSVSYDRAKDGYSYARKDDGTFAWTNILTPGVKNEFSVDLSQQKSTNSVRSNAQQTALKKNSSSLKKFTYTSRMTAEKSSRARASFSSFSKKFQNPYLADITSGDGAAGSTLSVLPYLPIVSIGLMFIVTKVIKFFVGRKLL